MKEIGYLRRQNPFEAQSAKQIGLGFIVRFIKTRLRRDELGQQFAELAKLDQARVRVVMEVSFCKRSQPHELNVAFTTASQASNLFAVANRSAGQIPC